MTIFSLERRQQPHPHELSLEGIPNDLAINMLRNVHVYGDSMQEDFATPEGFRVDVESAASDIVRSAIAQSMPRRSNAVVDAERIATRMSSVDTLAPGDELTALEEAEFKSVFHESTVVRSDQLAFMARCVLRAAVRSEDPADRKQSRLTLDWLEHNKAARPILKEVLHPHATRSRHIMAGAGKLALFSMLLRHR